MRPRFLSCAFVRIFCFDSSSLWHWHRRKSFPTMKTLFALPVVVFTITRVAIAAEPAAKDSRVFELRTYYAAPGKLNDLHARFRDHTMALFEKHGMVNI